MLQSDHTSPSPIDHKAPADVRTRWRSWLVGVALVVAVSIAALHFSEAEEIARLAERAQPWWLLLAFTLQAGTYLAQGEIWRAIGNAAGFPLTRAAVFRLSLAKLFVDQALPSAGISGTAAVAKYLEQAGMAKPAVMASVVINLTSYFVAYVVLLLSALLLLPLSGPAGKAVMLAIAVFVACSVALIVLMLVLPGRVGPRFARHLGRIRPLKGLVAFFEEADTVLVRDRRLFSIACANQAAIMLLDAATVLVLIKALGVAAPAPAVFASFMISNVFRSIGILPGGLGTFETSSVLTLQLVSVPLPVALSATLLFRGLSFWLPMVPGMWLSRRIFGTRQNGSASVG